MNVHPVTPELWPALAALFDQGGDPRRCWCMYWRARGTDWSTFTREHNRGRMEGLVAEGGRPPGLLAMDDDGSPIGWVSVAPREEYERLEHSRVLARVDDTPVWSIVCFVVSKRMRRQGLARQLLDAAAAYAAAEGAAVLEGYPAATDGQRTQSAWLYTGTTSMFEGAGFERVATRQANRATLPRSIYRKTLR